MAYRENQWSRWARWISFSLLGMALFFGFQNCQQKKFEVSDTYLAKTKNSQTSAQNNNNSSNSTTGPLPPVSSSHPTATASPTPTSVPTVQTCQTDSTVDACIVWKNMVAQNKGPLSPLPSYGLEQTSRLKYGVILPGLDTSGYLQNSTLNVGITDGVRVSKNTNGNWKYPYSANDTQHFPAQINAYYWAMQLMAQQENNGGFYAKNKNIAVDAFRASSSGSYFSFADNQLVMGNYAYANNTGRQEGSMFGEVVIHELGHGNCYYANNVTSFSSTLVKKMNPNGANSTGNLACTTVAGCYPSIGEAQSDLQYLFMFPTSPGFHNVVSMNLDGLKELELVRNPELIGTTSVSTIYSWPSDHGYASMYNGSVHLLSRAYTAAWWAVWKRAKAIGKERDIQRIFTEHLAKLTGSSTFQTALSSIIAIDQALFASSYSSMFNEEFTIRGIGN